MRARVPLEVHGPGLGRELWVARDLSALRVLEREGVAGLPVILADDVERLRGLDDRTVHAVLDSLAVWPGAQVADALRGEAGDVARR